MILDLYTDIYIGSEPKYVMALATPGVKSDGARRFRVSVKIPDEAFTGKIDGVLSVEDIVEVDK